MALINKLSNTASVTYDGQTVESNAAQTLLALPPTVTKAVDKASAKVGDTLTYTVTVANVSLSALTDLPFTDTLPAGSAYVADSFTVDSTAATPTVTGNTLTYTIPNIDASATATIQFRVTVEGGEN